MPVSYTRKSPAWVNGDVVDATDAERWESLGANTATWSGLADAGIHSRLMLSGRYYGPSIPYGSTDGGGTMPAGTVDMLPFMVTKTTTFDIAGINVATAGSAGSVIRLGIYNNGTDDQPGTLIRDIGTISSATTGDKTVTLSPTLTLDPNHYWLAMVTDSTNVLRVRKAAGALSVRGDRAMYGSAGVDVSDAGYSLRYTGYTATSAYPSTATKTGRSTMLQDMPLMWLRKA